MIEFSFNQAAAIVGGQLHLANASGDKHFIGITHDSRKVQRGNLYAALPGERADGHEFIEAAAQAGALLALVKTPLTTSVTQIEVGDVQLAMGQLAAAWRADLSVQVVGITGSNGKTTVKNMLAAIVRDQLRDDSAVLATPGNYNNEIGLPLTLAMLSDQHQFAILEMGCGKPGDIAYLAQLAKPQVAVVTNASAAHLKGLGSVEGVASTKGELFEALGVDDTAVINRDDRFFRVWLDRARPARVISFGMHAEADVRMNNGRVETPIGDFVLNINLPGRHNQLNALAATAAAIALGFDLEAIAAGLREATAEPGRLQLLPQPEGWLLIDDSYNANPASMQAAMQLLADQSGQQWLVIGDMAELADLAESEHAAVGEQARALGIDRLFAIGSLAAISAETFGPGGQAFERIENLIAELKSSLQAHAQNDVTCLVKGSRSAGMERVVSALNEQGAGAC